MPVWMRGTRKDWAPTKRQRPLMRQNETLNAVLYGMCEAHPDHGDRDAIRAKIVIIGRAYAAGLERHVRGIRSVTDLLHSARTWLDTDIRRLQRWGDHEPTMGRIEELARVHGRLQRELKKVTRGSNGVRSFVSKYLHFHAPVVPIFDQYAAASLKDWYHWPPMPSEGDTDYQELVRLSRMKPAIADEAYWKHLVRTAFVVQEWRLLGYAPRERTARTVDTYALAWWEEPS